LNQAVVKLVAVVAIAMMWVSACVGYRSGGLWIELNEYILLRMIAASEGAHALAVGGLVTVGGHGSDHSLPLSTVTNVATRSRVSMEMTSMMMKMRVRTKKVATRVTRMKKGRHRRCRDTCVFSDASLHVPNFALILQANQHGKSAP
jgi:hypothetical protein